MTGPKTDHDQAVTREQVLAEALGFVETRINCVCGASVALSNWRNHEAARRHEEAPAEALSLAGSPLALPKEAPLTESERLLLDDLSAAEARIAAVEAECGRLALLVDTAERVPDASAVHASLEALAAEMDAESAYSGHSSYGAFATALRRAAQPLAALAE
ncbi:MAG TPA: hypothetical protein DCQ64_14075 [Candidatus Rokubacteria bacterium]|nr:hypothetical protein [Candidatus Rokubacteria bacterium]